MSRAVKRWVALRDRRRRETKSMRAALDEAIFRIERLSTVNDELVARVDWITRFLQVAGFAVKGSEILPIGRVLPNARTSLRDQVERKFESAHGRK